MAYYNRPGGPPDGGIVCITRQFLRHSNTAATASSYGISGSTDHGTGDYSWTCSSSYASVNYSLNATSEASTNGRLRGNNTARDATNVLASKAYNSLDGTASHDAGRVKCVGDY